MKEAVRQTDSSAPSPSSPLWKREDSIPKQPNHSTNTLNDKIVGPGPPISRLKLEPNQPKITQSYQCSK